MSETGRLVLKTVNEQTAPEFWLKPCGLRRHEHSGVCDGQKFIHGCRIHGKGNSARAVCSFLESFQTADSADKMDAGIGFRLGDSEDGGEDSLLQDRHVKISDRISRIYG